MNNPNPSGKPEASPGVGWSAWLGVSVKGYHHEMLPTGEVVRRPATLSQQLRSVESMLGAQHLKKDLTLFLQAPASL